LGAAVLTRRKRRRRKASTGEPREGRAREKRNALAFHIAARPPRVDDRAANGHPETVSLRAHKS
jgi:hypothetical protein